MPVGARFSVCTLDSLQCPSFASTRPLNHPTPPFSPPASEIPLTKPHPGGFGSGRSSSYYKRSPRQGYLKRVYAKLRRLLRDLIYYMKKNPLKVFMLVIMPLLTGGALTTLLAKFGLRLPPGLQKLFGGKNGGRGGGGYEYSHTKVEGPLGALGGLGGVASMMGGMGGIGSAVSLAKMFM